MASYDTGTYENHISLYLAIRLGYSVDTNPELVRELNFANGKTVTSLGVIAADISFARASGEDDQDMVKVVFNVFETLALPAIMGFIFLQATETLTRYQSRLVDVSLEMMMFPRIFALGAVTNQVPCTVDGNIATAHADTGSTIALISGDFALRHGLLQGYGCEKLMLADGSIEYTSGFADIEVRILKQVGLKKQQASQIIRFHVSKNLQFDIVFDEQLVDDFQIFRDAATSLFGGLDGMSSWLAPIIRLGKLEQSLLNTKENVSERIRQWTKTLLAFTQKEKAEGPCPATDSNAAADVDVQKRRLLQRIHQHSQAENRRLDRVSREARTEVQENAELQIRLQHREEHDRLFDEYMKLVLDNP